MAKKYEERLAQAKSEYEGKNIVAILGKTSYGKSVVSTLFYDAIDNFFLKKHSDEYNARIVKGHDYQYKSHKELFSGKFPPPTPPGQETEIVLEISRKPPLAKRIELVTHDISGEDVSALLLSQHSSPEELINYILTYPSASDSPGPFSYVLFAKVYIVLIDCSEHKFWRSEQIKISQKLSSILDIKQGLGEASNGKSQTPIAIVLTKADTYEDAASIDAEELIRNEMPQVYSNLSEHFTGRIGYFKVHIDATERNKEEIEKLITDHVQNIEDQNEREKLLKEKEIEEQVRLTVAEAKKTSLAQGQQPPQAEEIAKAAGEAKRLSLMREMYGDEHDTLNLELLRKYYRYQIKMPVNYTSDIYITLICWIITNI